MRVARRRRRCGSCGKRSREGRILLRSRRAIPGAGAAAERARCGHRGRRPRRGHAPRAGGGGHRGRGRSGKGVQGRRGRGIGHAVRSARRRARSGPRRREGPAIGAGARGRTNREARHGETRGQDDAGCADSGRRSCRCSGRTATQRRRRPKPLGAGPRRQPGWRHGAGGRDTSRTAESDMGTPVQGPWRKSSRSTRRFSRVDR